MEFLIQLIGFLAAGCMVAFGVGMVFVFVMPFVFAAFTVVLVGCLHVLGIVLQAVL
jgi:hypothetical protein